MISLFYLLTYLFKKGRLPNVQYNNNLDGIKRFDIVRQAREVESSQDLCFGNTEDLLDFHKEVFKYQFKDQPNYKLLI